MDGFPDSMDMNLSQLWEVEEDREAWTVLQSRGHKGLDMTWRLNSNNERLFGFHDWLRSGGEIPTGVW